MTNHWWNAPLYLTARGLGTSLIPIGSRAFDVELDLLSSRLQVRTSDGRGDDFPLERTTTVKDFHQRFFDMLRGLDVDVSISPLAVEIVQTIHLDRDETERAYDAAWARRLFDALLRADAALKEFRGGFEGKASPVHFFWGSFDLAASRFSGRRAPPHPGGAPHVAGHVMREAYSHEVSSAGLWAGGFGCPEPLFYAYAYPEPQGFAKARVRPAEARYDERLREFVLPYDAVRRAPKPSQALREFLDSTYTAEAELARWPRADLERALDELEGGERHELRM
jgi:hypothetical protein